MSGSIKTMVFGFALLLAGCGGMKTVKRELIPPQSFQELKKGKLYYIEQSSPFLKIHMKNGNVYVLRDWQVSDNRQYVNGTGTLFNSNRDVIKTGSFKVGVDSVAIFETNVIENSGAMTALTIITGLTAALTAYGIMNPKACFGSCPTFYASDGDSMRLQAEGFSASIAPSLEATDTDALFHALPKNREIEIRMKNEALETHVVRQVNLLAVPRYKDKRVFLDTNGRFWQTDSLFPPVSVNAPEGNPVDLLLYADGRERFSRADSTYLGAKEVLQLEFNVLPHKKYGLVIGCRQTLLSTYLLYQTYAYMGNNVGYWFSRIEQKQIKLGPNSITNVLGGIEVLIQDSRGRWKKVGNFNEYGPLAIDFHLLPIGKIKNKKLKIRLKMTKGNWRIDYVALAELLQSVPAICIQPYVVMNNGVVDEKARSALLDSAKTLVTLPGDIYTLKYHLPATPPFGYELFLQSRGYYLEWIRKEWIEEENPMLLAQIFLSPDQALRRLAPQFKKVEKKMEYCFWKSRYAKP